MPFPFNITLVQGDDFPFQLTFYEDDDATPVSMDGKTLSLTIKPTYDEDDTDAAALIALDTADFTVDEDTGVSGTNNRVSGILPRADTALMPVGTHVIDFQVVDGALLQTQGRGQCVVLAQVTRRTPS